ncbi:DNA repair protein RAD51 homolog 4 isoform X1 [Syngnathus acus]|uniref:DNA repair protein RAD51 homolog 4 isoform X1 n=1 Tax=Syngnathus acus TaxID=161584 RepID=UPI0018861F23|nr:DNA repair protein RAD51 homolog 4 isoform X1 [Syngnathus acus]
MVLLREGMCPGLDEDLLRRLRDAHVKTVEDLVSSDMEDLAQKSSASYKALIAIRRVLLAQHAAFPVSGADLYDEVLSATAILSTGNPDLDTLLDSGVYTGEITELAGGPASGKTQVCLGVAAHVAQHLRQNVIFVDTTGGLSARRLRQMLQTQTSSHDEQMEALQRIAVHRAFDIFSLLDCLHRLGDGGLRQVSASGGSVKALIVDSVSAVIAPLLGSRHQERMYMMSQVAITLKTMAKNFNIAALVRRNTHTLTHVVGCHLVVSATSTGDQSRDAERGGQGAAWPGRVVESHPKNPSPAGATFGSQQPALSTLRHSHQVLQAAMFDPSQVGPSVLELLRTQHFRREKSGRGKFLTTNYLIKDTG